MKNLEKKLNETLDILSEDGKMKKGSYKKYNNGYLIRATDGHYTSCTNLKKAKELIK